MNRFKLTPANSLRVLLDAAGYLLLTGMCLALLWLLADGIGAA